ncbi:MAG: hypothetical protein M3463_08655 [Verrucomicrobiota bacterium]|nr:hypothetical protein [Verrucomicrobiota bacterium]
MPNHINAHAAGAKFTTAPVQPWPEWVRPADARPIFGIGRSLLYQLISEGQVHSVCLRREGKLAGMRLVSAASLREYIARHGAGDAAVPIVAAGKEEGQ